MRKSFVACSKYIAAFMLLVLAGCGSSSTTSQDPVKEESKEKSEVSEKEKKDSDGKQDPDEKNEQGEKTEPEEKKDPNDERDYIKISLSSSKDFSIDTIKDTYRGTSSYWIRTGNIVWPLQKVSAVSDDVESVCYDDETANCGEYGRLFSAKENPAHRACPSGQNLASSKDWALLESFRSEHREIDSLMDLKYGGACEKVNGSLKCSGLDVAGNYLTSDGKVYSISVGKDAASFGTAKSDGYYNVRCVSYVDYVKSIKDLPDCDPTLKSPPEVIYVFDEMGNYRCYSKEKSWLPDFSESCRVDGKKIVFDKVMMICEDGLWQLADISYSPEKCTSENQGKILPFNGVNYTCDSSSWRKFTELEDSIGVCNSRKAGVFDTVFSGIVIKPYYCDGKKWEEASIEMYKGPCEDSTSKFMNDTIDFKNMLYVCRGNGWVEYDSLEKRFGVCTPQKLFMFENGSYDIDDDKTEYLCDTAGWVKFTPWNIIGRCNPEKEEITIYRDKHYLCESSGGLRQYWPDVATLRPRDSVMYSCNKPEDSGNVLSGRDTSFVTCSHSSIGGDSYGSSWGRFGKCNKENEGMDTTYANKPIYCGGNGYWHNVYEGLEKCTTKNYGSITKSAQYGRVVCDDIGWRSLERFEDRLGICSTQNEGNLVEDDGEKFLCMKGVWKRYKDKSTYRVNGSKKEGK